MLNVTIKEQNACFIRDLPILRYISNIFKNSISLENVLIVCVQHVVSTTYTLFHELFEMGLKPENLIVLGKCYSTYPAVFDQLQKEGVNISPLSKAYNSHESYDTQFDSYLDSFILQLKIKELYQYDKIIILDDGGNLLEKANKFLPKDLCVVGIEQTSSGYHKIKEHNISFPIINLARSHVKIVYEAPFIAQLAIERLFFYLPQLKKSDISKILIIGNGVIGSAIYRALKEKGIDSSVYDSNVSQSDFDDFELISKLGDYDIIIGCTGKTVIKNEYHSLLKQNAILASVSSSDLEFDSVFLRKSLPLTEDPHRNIINNGICLLNSGFPINFDKDFDLIDPNILDLTRSIIFSGIIQSVNSSLTLASFIDLDFEMQNKIIYKYIHIYGNK